MLILRRWWILPETIVCIGCLSPNSLPPSFHSCLFWWKVLIHYVYWLNWFINQVQLNMWFLKQFLSLKDEKEKNAFLHQRFCWKLSIRVANNTCNTKIKSHLKNNTEVCQKSTLKKCVIIKWYCNIWNLLRQLFAA